MNRTVPHSPEAEQSVLGALLLDGTAWHSIAGAISAADFYRPDHRLIFEAIGVLAGSGRPCDVVTVSDHLERTSELDSAGGLAYLSTIARGMPTAANVRAYADIVRERSLQRRLLEIGGQIERAMADGKTSAELVANVQSTLEALRNGTRAVDALEPIRAAIRADIETPAEAIDAAEPPRFVQYPHIPEAGASLCGPGGTGKTALALCEKIQIACGRPVYEDAEPHSQGACVLVTAEDGADRVRYVLQRALADGVESRQITEAQAKEAKQLIRVVGWDSPRFGRIVKVDPATGEMYRAPVYDLLLELLAPLNPVYVTFDPEALFAPGERYGNDGHAFLASLIHQTAMAMRACVQMLDHVSQNVARGGIVDQYASRGGTAKSDEARLVRQLVTAKPENLKPDEPLPLTVSPDDVASGSVLRLHWTKLSWAKPNAAPPVWLRRSGYWFQPLRSPSPTEYAAQREQGAAQRDFEELSVNAGAVVEYIGQQLLAGSGIRLTASELANEGGPVAKGKRIKRDPIRRAIRHALAEGLLKHLELPREERRGQRQTYLAPAGYEPPHAQASP